MKVKDILVYTNPITLFMAIPVFTGIVLSVMFDGVATKTVKILKAVDKDMEVDRDII